MLAVLLLRRIAYTLLALYRAVTLRSDEDRATRWKALLQSVRDVLIAATEEQLAGVRLRDVAATHLSTPGSYPRRATSQGPGATGWRERRRPPQRPLAPTSSRLPPPAHWEGRNEPARQQAGHAWKSPGSPGWLSD